jgi:hypothetical protein
MLYWCFTAALLLRYLRPGSALPQQPWRLVRKDAAYLRGAERRSSVSICTVVPAKQVNRVPEHREAVGVVRVLSKQAREEGESGWCELPEMQ